MVRDSCDVSPEVCPDVHDMFALYNQVYFQGALDSVLLQWSRRLTSCAGMCYYNTTGSCRIALSEPLLKYRSKVDVQSTLLHEMIHAWEFISAGKGERMAHGPVFRGKMREINTSSCEGDPYRPTSGYRVTVRHDWAAEVDHLRQHCWVCEDCGKCVHRARNRPPSVADCWSPAKSKHCMLERCSWHSHARHCGGVFVKVSEPDGYANKRKRSNTGTVLQSRASSSSGLDVDAVDAKMRWQTPTPVKTPAGADGRRPATPGTGGQNDQFHSHTPQLDVFDHVRLRGLVGARELNGQIGVCEEFDVSAGRWIVRLESGEAKALKPVSLIRHPPELRYGAEVLLTGLSCNSHLNGSSGVCEHYDPETGRWQVRLDNFEVKALRPEHLIVQAPTLQPGAIVSIVNLQGATHLNGHTGVCERFDPVSSRWIVRLKSGDCKALRQDNLQPPEVP